MFDVNDDAKDGFRRIELLTGPGRRRRWSAEAKSQVVAETAVPGACVSEVARRWHVSPQQVFGWRRDARADVTPSLASKAAQAGSLPIFVPIVTAQPQPSPPPAPWSQAPAPISSIAAVIEIRIAGAVVRAEPGTDCALLTAVLRAVRNSAKSA